MLKKKDKIHFIVLKKKSIIKILFEHHPRGHMTRCHAEKTDLNPHDARVHSDV